MNDPVLNRKLFRHQAQIIHNKIPKYQTGGGPQSPFTATGFQQAASAIPKRDFLKDLRWLISPGKYAKGAKYAAPDKILPVLDKNLLSCIAVRAA